MDDRPAPSRPTWLTAAMVACGVLGAPAAILALALAAGGLTSSESGAVGIAYAAFLIGSIAVSAVRAVRPLGVGMILGSGALALMFVLQGGTTG